MYLMKNSMNTTKLTPKEMAQKRAQGDIMKTELRERRLCIDKENENPQLPPLRKTCFRIHDRETKEFSSRNPFDIPNQQRLFTKSKAPRKPKPEPFIMSEPHTICDIDATFYKKIEGRPLRTLDDIKVYIRTIRDITLHRANTAYFKDQIIQIDTSFAEETSEYNTINKLFINSKDNFFRFARESYIEAKAIQEQAKEKAMELEMVTDKLESLSFKYVALRNKLGVINITYETLSKYRTFLFSVSPLTWRKVYDEEYVETNTPHKPASERLRKSEYSLDHYKAIADKKPILFFTTPRQLDVILNNLSRQCLTYMEIEVFSSSLVKSVLKSRDYLKAQVLEEIDELTDFIETYKGHVKFMEVKEQEFKAHFERILVNEFQELYASYDASKLFTCLQYTNTQVFQGPEDPKDSITSLMLQLEKEYIKLTSAFDDLNQEVVKEATNEFFSQDLRMMKLAHLAQRNLKECDILSKALYTSFEPPRRRYKL